MSGSALPRPSAPPVETQWPTSYEDYVALRWSALYRTAYLMTGAHVDGSPDARRIDLPEGADVRAVRWEDETHVLLTLFGDRLGTAQSLLRCDVTDGASSCEYAVPPAG